MAQEIGGIDGIDGRGGIAPPVRFEPCAEFRVDRASAWPVCDACGWLADDHATVAADTIVTALSRRAVQLPERKAS